MRTVLQEDEILLMDGYQYINLIKTIPGRRWDPTKRAWIVPATIASIEILKQVVKLGTELEEIYRSHTEVKQQTEREKNLARVEPMALMPLKPHIQPFQHQIKGYNMALRNGSFAYLFEMGCGKTLTSIATIGRLYLDKKIKSVLIVAPTSVVPVWPKELEAYGDFDYRVKALEGSSSNRIKDLNLLETWEGLQIAVINYESTWRIVDALLNWRPDMIIADESQRIKSPTAKQSKALHRLGDAGKYKLILSGTPVQNAPLDLWSQYRFLDKNVFGTSYYAFKARHAIMGGYGKHQVIGYRHMDELIRKAHGIALRVTKEEALDLPETTDEIRYCQLEPKAASLYKKLVKDSYIQLEKGEITAQNVLTRLLRLSQLTGGYIHTDEGITKEISTAKLEVMREIVEDRMAEGKKLVIFARFLPEIKAIGKMLEKMGLEYSCITGAVKNRGEEVRRFQEEEECRVFIAQIQTAGLGITLHAADTAVFYSLDFNYANYAQAKARIHRIGQRNTCTYIHLMAPNTVDEKIMAALEKKKNIAKEVVDNWREYFE